jgi:hypothetical protein
VSHLSPSLGLLAPLALTGSLSAVEPTPDARRDIERAAVFIDEAVRQTSRPSPLGLFEAAQMTRGYRIPGVGVVFVVPSRSLPSPRTKRWRERELEAQQAAAKALRPAAPPARQAASQALPGGTVGGPAGTSVVTGGSMLLHGENLSPADQERAVRAFEEQIRLFHENSIRDHLQTEKAFEEMMRRFDPDGQQRGQLLAPPLPWDSPFEEPPETRTPRQVLDDVRQGLAQALAQAATAPSFLANDESLVVTVDFFDDDVVDFEARPVSTLVARVNSKDVAALRAQTLSFDDFQKRIEYSEIP